jgi:hypothetical protein
VLRRRELLPQQVVLRKMAHSGQQCRVNAAGVRSSRNKGPTGQAPTSCNHTSARCGETGSAGPKVECLTALNPAHLGADAHERVHGRHVLPDVQALDESGACRQAHPVSETFARSRWTAHCRSPSEQRHFALTDAFAASCEHVLCKPRTIKDGLQTTCRRHLALNEARRHTQTPGTCCGLQEADHHDAGVGYFDETPFEGASQIGMP